MLKAPLPDVVASVHPSGRAVVVSSDAGVEVLLHVRLDTVALGGCGFVPPAVQGRRVVASEPLLAFEANLVVRGRRFLDALGGPAKLRSVEA